MPDKSEVFWRSRIDLWSARLHRARYVLVTAAAALLFLNLFGPLSLLEALFALAAIAAGALVGDFPAPVGLPAAAPTSRPRLDFADARLESVLAGFPDPVIALGRDGRVLALNAQASTLVPALHRGEPASLALRMPEVVDALRRASAAGQAQRVEFFQRVPLDRWFEVVVTPVKYGPRGTADAPDLILMTFHDLTPLRRADEMRADFVANASHELRTPLAALSGFIDTLQGSARDDPAARQRFLAIMHTQATRMARLIDDLLSLSRIELNAHLRPQTPVDLVSIVRQVRDSLETLARDNDVKIQIQAPEEPFIVLGDRDELIRVFENLIENALKYGAAGKRVEIDFAYGEGTGGQREARVSVRDYGPGIAPEHLPRLTERFYRVDVAESCSQGGTGLGLALVKHILNRHGGRLVIESVLGAGATFTVRLPIVGKSGDASVSPMNSAA